MNKKLYATLAGLGMITVASAEDLDYSKLPQAVQNTIQQNLGGGVVDEIEREQLNGRTVYEVEIEREGEDHEIWIDSDGTLITEPKEGLSRVFQKGDGKILGIPVRKEKETGADPGVASRGVEVEAEVEAEKPAVAVEAGRAGSINAVTTDADGGLDTDDGDGRILGVPKRGFEALPMSKVPAAVRETIRREARDHRIAEIELATKDGMQVYEVDVEKDGRNRELHIAADGKIVQDSENEAVGSAPGSEKGRVSDR